MLGGTFWALIALRRHRLLGSELPFVATRRAPTKRNVLVFGIKLQSEAGVSASIKCHRGGTDFDRVLTGHLKGKGESNLCGYLVSSAHKEYFGDTRAAWSSPLRSPTHWSEQ